VLVIIFIPLFLYYSSSDDGNAVLILLSSADESKEAVFSIGEPITAVALEPGRLNGGRKDRSFLLGTEKGRLIYHNPTGSWSGSMGMGFSSQKKDIILFPGDGTPIYTLSWCKGGNYVAWADINLVRVMDVVNQTAICQLQPPYGVGVDDPFPCSLFWKTDNELMVGWADSFKVIRIEENKDQSDNGAGEVIMIPKIARTLVSWQSDTVITGGIFPLDDEHVIYLGYSPPPDEFQPEDDDLAPIETVMKDSLLRPVRSDSLMNEPELIIASFSTGEIISADVLPLNGINMKGPYGYFLLSSYQVGENVKDSKNWKLKNSSYSLKTSGVGRGGRGGDRGNAPLLFVLALEDMIVARIRDVNDRVRSALEQKNLRLAVEIGNSDRNSLRIYSFSDLLSLYLGSLLDRQLIQEAAKEASRLIGMDVTLWGTWVEKFISLNQLTALCPVLPVEKPRLNCQYYEEILQKLMDNNPLYFLEILRSWSKVKPPLFDHSLIVETLQKRTSSVGAESLYHYNEAADLERDVVWNSIEYKSCYLSAQAHLYLISNQYEKALNAYLKMSFPSDEKECSDGEDTGELKGHSGSNSEHRQIFELIEKQSLFSVVESKVINLIKISKELSGKLLVNNIDKLPIKSIAHQLSSDNRLLHWYLHLLFTDPVTKDIYSEKEEYADLHKKQVKLYADFAPLPTYVKSAGKQDPYSGKYCFFVFVYPYSLFSSV
jgi:hypothetical protein